MKGMKFENKDIKINISTYSDKHLCISLETKEEGFEEPVAVITKDFDTILQPYTQFVTHEQILKMLEKENLGLLAGTGLKGTDTYPLVMFNPQKLAEENIEGLEVYERLNKLTENDRKDYSMHYKAVKNAKRNRVNEVEYEQ